MATNSDVVASSLRLIGVLAEGESVSAEQANDALPMMNDLFLEWDANGIDIGFVPQTDINAESPIFTDALQAAKYNLAVVLASDYGFELKPAVAALAISGYSRLLRDAQTAQMVEADMTHLPGVVSPTNILDG